MDNGKVTSLTLFNYPVAFNAINHTIIMGRFSLWYGYTGLNLILLIQIELRLGIVFRHH